jgi:hypothetical protein
MTVHIDNHPEKVFYFSKFKSRNMFADTGIDKGNNQMKKRETQ